VRRSKAQLLFAIVFPICTAFAQPSSTTVPQWQIAAGGKMSFEVASIKLNAAGFQRPSFPLDAGPAFASTGGRFFASFPLMTYINFAWKLLPSPDERQAMFAHLPKWASTDAFEIEARAPISNPTKDQMRLMMQSLLAERFHLTVHFESQTMPAFAMVLAKPGKTGPQLKPHSEGPPCAAGDQWPAPATANAFPPMCDVFMMEILPNHSRTSGSRNTTMQSLAASVPTFGSVSRPVVDRTGLAGTFDFKLEWAPDATTPDAPTDSNAPAFTTALNEQLGLKLEPIRAPIDILIVDHVERPSEN
jgi:uncharacterized protein (TIGR03435 family)